VPGQGVLVDMCYYTIIRDPDALVHRCMCRHMQFQQCSNLWDPIVNISDEIPTGGGCKDRMDAETGCFLWSPNTIIVLPNTLQFAFDFTAVRFGRALIPIFSINLAAHTIVHRVRIMIITY